jgi:UDP-N-acetylmuramoyl-tripeptide--D-alanyl-D-alanine ligase
LIDMTLGEVAGIVHGGLSGADPQIPVTAPVEFDSRKVTPGGLFLALRGEHVDGHDYVEDAIEAGARAVLVTRPVNVPSIEVEDAFAALAALASAVVRRLPDVTVVGVTGSSGKTSTKDLLAQLLERLGPTVAPPASFNNELGHPYTVLQSTADTRYLVLEMSARGIGHIRYLAEIAPPSIGVVLNVGSAHLGEFGTRDAIAQAKGELIGALSADGVAVLNADDPLVTAMAGRTSARVVTFGEAAGADVRADGVRLEDLERPSFVLHGGTAAADVTLRLSGQHQVANALAAAAVALECGMSLPEVAAGLSQATARSKWRMQVTQRPDGVVVLNDAYNANPESTRAALKTLAGIGRSRSARTWAVLGEMAELGDAAAAAHDAIGRLAVRLDVSRLVAVGEPARAVANGAALEGSWSGESTWVPDADAAIALLHEQISPGDVVLVKASRAVGLEQVALELGR